MVSIKEGGTSVSKFDATINEPSSTDKDVGEPSILPAGGWSPQEEKALVRKIDLRIFPFMIILFILNFIDRNNFSNARLKGLQTDLHLSDVQYETCLSILLVGYVVFQLPSNLVLNAITKPSWYLCACVAVWGVVSAATGATRTAAGALACRFFLGCVEAAFFPGCLYYLSRWYTRREMQLRVTLLNAGNLAAQAFGSLIAAGILADMQGARGLAGWRWLFIVEGAVTVAVAALAVFFLPQYPGTTPWLSAWEQGVAEARLALGNREDATGGDEDVVTAKEGLVMAVKDPKVWLLGITYLATIMGLSFSYFFPTITQALGFDTTTTLLLAAPPWIWALLVSLPNAWHADRTGERFFHFFGPALTCMVGYIISATTTTTAPRYIAMFLMTTGYASGFVMLAWISNTITRPRAKRAAAIAIVNAMGNIGSIPGSYIWPSKYGPLYVKSFGAEIAILGFASISALTLRYYLRSLNKKMDAGERSSELSPSDMGEADQDQDQDQDQVNTRKGNGFRYLY